MPLYLVRWPGLVAALVNATDEDELLDILDETANPEGCTWTLYRGPLYLELALNADYSIDGEDKVRELPIDPSEVKVGDVTRICERDVLSAVIDRDSETAANMVDRVVQTAFPALHKVLRKVRETIPESEVRDAVRAELDRLLQASWQHQQTKRRPDQESRVAAMMGTSPRLVAHWSRVAAGVEVGKRPAPKKPKKPTKPKGNGRTKKPTR